jgi:hypothetical protein
MSKIPSYINIKQDTPDLRHEVESGAPARAGQGVAKGLMDVSRTVGAYQETVDKEEFAKAKTNFMIDLVANNEEIKSDPDYATHLDKYDKSASETLASQSGTIGSQKYRTAFEQDARLQIAQDREQLSNVVTAKKNEHDVADFLTRSSTAADAAVLGGGDKILQTRDSINMEVDSLVEREAMSPVEGVKFKKDFMNGVALRHIKALPYDQQAAAINEPWAITNLPEDVRLKLLREAEEETNKAEATTMVDEYLDNELTYDEARKQAKKDTKGKPGLRKVADGHLDYEYNRRSKADAQVQSDLFDNYYGNIALGKATVEQVNAEDWVEMTPEMQRSLIAAQRSAVSDKKTGYNLAADDHLMLLTKQKKFIEARNYFTENASDMSQAQQNEWSKLTIEGLTPEHKGPFNARQMVQDSTPKYSKEQRGPIYEEITEWFMDVQQSTGADPTDKEVKERIQSVILKYDTSWWWGGTKSMVDMDESEKNSVMADAKEEDPDTFDKVAEYFKRIGAQPDQADYMRAYTVLRDNQSVE